MAADIGFDPRSLTFSHRYDSANGDGLSAPVLLPEVAGSCVRIEAGTVKVRWPAVVRQ